MAIQCLNVSTPLIGEIVNEAINETHAIVVIPDSYSLELIKNQVDFFCQSPSVILPSWDCFPYERVSPSADIISQRLKAFRECQTVQKPICLITTVKAFFQKISPIESFSTVPFTLSAGDTYSRTELFHFLESQAYRRVELVCEVGEYAVRGSLIDIFPVGHNYPLRLDFFDETLEVIKTFEVSSQTSRDKLDKVTLFAAQEILLNPETIKCYRTHYRKLFNADISDDYKKISSGKRFEGVEHWAPLFYEKLDKVPDLLPQAKIILCEGVEEDWKNFTKELHYHYEQRHYSKVPALKPDLLYWSQEEYDQFGSNFEVLKASALYGNEQYAAKPIPSIRHTHPLDPPFETLKLFIEKYSSVLICCRSLAVRTRIYDLCQEYNLDAEQASQFSEIEKGLVVIHFPLEENFLYKDFLFISDKNLLGQEVFDRRLKRASSKNHMLNFSGILNRGDFVVHKDHGIALYDGLITIDINSQKHDCLQLQYDGGDKLFLPIENFDLVSRYGASDSTVALDKLGSAAWQMRKAKAKEKIRAVADYLIKLAAQRTLDEAPIYDTHSPLFDQFCEEFPYVETDDQLKAMDEVLDDFKKGKPMDRLICGDVGFGKTEIALRSAFIAVNNGYQVLIVAPTTLLARQHTEIFKKRFENFPFKVEGISRIVNKKSADNALQGFKEGNVHILISTHAAFSERLQCKNLGLVILDEEQHFGVKQKEKLKSLQKNVHMLTLTATPIPRTLQLSLTGVRDLSLIATPPTNRMPIKTFVMAHDTLLIKDAIMREKNRGGQVFYVTPRIEYLKDLEDHLKTNVDCRFASIHGKMKPKDLERIMTDFYDKKFDVLLSTNIIESGIDLPSANTLLVHRADMFGLSQLYQLRGRVGRSKMQGYAYLTAPEEALISSKALKRLKVLKSLDHLGASFSLASHDLDIRGAGNVVGEEQSGHIKEVGVELYQNLLQEAILMERTKKDMEIDHLENEWTPQINVGLPVLIPETYINDLDLRLQLYRQIVSLKTQLEIDQFIIEMMDRFGPVPQEVKNLLGVVSIKQQCLKAGIEKVDVGPQGIVFSFYKNTFQQPHLLLAYLQKYKQHVRLRPDQKVVFFMAWHEPNQRLKNVIKICREIGNLLRKKEE